jgi:hypothetical protein
MNPHVRPRLACAVAMLIASSALTLPHPARAADDGAPPATDHPGCEHATPRACVALAMVAMGGRQKLAAISNEQIDVIGHRTLAEQSYRQDPFITAYTRTHRTVDFASGHVLNETHTTWPESDPGTTAAEVSNTLIATAQAAIVHTGSGDAPAPLSSIDDARATLALGPERLLLTADAAPDLHYEASETLRSTPHTVLAFHWNGMPVKLLLNGFNHLPDALESTRGFDDYWFAWGDVHQRVYFDNWKILQGVVYPTNRVEERNGIPWSSAQVLDAKFNVALDDKQFAMDPKAAAQSAQAKGWDATFDDSDHVALAPGVDLYQGSWNVTLIRQDDGVLVLETPISPRFAQGVLAKARKDNPTLPIKGVLTTSDSWPHLAGVREAVAEKLPVYALDLNRPILDRLVNAPHTLRPDELQLHPQPPHWITVSGKLAIGSGPNRVVLYPLRGAATERQYMVYFPQHKLLYASDTLVLESKHTVYDPELVREVMQAVEREHLDVDTVYAMHQGPTSWSEVTRLVTAATQG